jgi:hypothetical protein
MTIKLLKLIIIRKFIRKIIIMKNQSRLARARGRGDEPFTAKKLQRSAPLAPAENTNWTSSVYQHLEALSSGSLASGTKNCYK